MFLPGAFLHTLHNIELGGAFLDFGQVLVPCLGSSRQETLGDINYLISIYTTCEPLWTLKAC